jgi:hypothetical protein
MCKLMFAEFKQGHPICVLHQNNSGEDVKLVKTAKGKDWKLDFEPEFTTQKTLNRTLMPRHHSQLLQLKPDQWM